MFKSVGLANVVFISHCLELKVFHDQCSDFMLLFWVCLIEQRFYAKGTIYKVLGEPRNGNVLTHLLARTAATHRLNFRDASMTSVLVSML